MGSNSQDVAKAKALTEKIKYALGAKEFALIQAQVDIEVAAQKDQDNEKNIAKLKEQKEKQEKEIARLLAEIEKPPQGKKGSKKNK